MSKSVSYILIVEDEPINTLYLEAILKPLLHDKLKLLTAVNGLEAVTICEQNDSVALVLMDIRMMVMNGYEATRRIKAFKSDLPIIAQTSFASIDDKVDAIVAGCDDYITKPINKDLLLEKVQEYLEFE